MAVNNKHSIVWCIIVTMSFLVIYSLILINLVSEITNSSNLHIYALSNIISNGKILSVIASSTNNTVESEAKSEMATYVRQFLVNHLSVADNINENIKWGIRGMAMFILPLLIGAIPSIENKLFNIFCAKGKRVYNVGFYIEKQTIFPIK